MTEADAHYINMVNRYDNTDCLQTQNMHNIQAHLQYADSGLGLHASYISVKYRFYTSRFFNAAVV